MPPVTFFICLTRTKQVTLKIASAMRGKVSLVYLW